MNLLMLLCLACAARAAEPEVVLRVPVSPPAFGEELQAVAVATLSPGTDVELDLQRSATDYFTIAKVEDAGEADENGTKVRKFKLAIVPLAVGHIPIDLYWNAVTVAGKTAISAPSTVFLDVPEPKLDGPEPAPIDIKEPRAARPALWPWLLAALLGAGAWELYRRRKARLAEAALAPPPPDDRPAEVIALDELDALGASPLWTEGRFKDYYFRLTEVMRRYLERRFGIPATHLTTAELYRHVRQAELDRPLVVLFKDIFDRADLVKFAKAAPEPDWGAKDLSGARSLVQQTTPKDLMAAHPGPEKRA